ncbi:MAG TPA: DUF3524 domain-containing protein, partial [Geobacteraceae bacterium]
ALYCACHPLLPDRLAYPEHIPAEGHDLFLYGEGTLAARLRDILQRGTASAPDLAGVRSHVGRYDWRHLAPGYDDLLESVRAEG